MARLHANLNSAVPARFRPMLYLHKIILPLPPGQEERQFCLPHHQPDHTHQRFQLPPAAVVRVAVGYSAVGGLDFSVGRFPQGQALADAAGGEAHFGVSESELVFRQLRHLWGTLHRPFRDLSQLGRSDEVSLDDSR